ncbi:NAD(P)H-binding protein [Zhihengliuella halotolerans]|uniref:NAD(P)H dehydrogenase (Quinone) n=1 Tax=Zhihengliuella halotolerans TaxID=370736 RepID=A0A4Q8AAV6_9MICC|nr:NAD(P)H-binding protein [Zhihengliuella halotolerans]RZU61257.1 NAD(P)H dehydrogenase (quinone) [Zhihengliuella halotolerans]
MTGTVTEENQTGVLMILVTGASGQLASRIVTHLHALGADAVGGSRSPDEHDRALDFDVPATLDLTGVDTLVLVSAGYAEDDVVVHRHSTVLEAARRDGVGHVVYTSLVGAGDHLAFALAHRATERLLRNSGMRWTILRNGLYAELVGALLSWEEAHLVSPFGAGSIAAPTRDDLALAAALVAADPPGHVSRVHELTGPPFAVLDIANELAAPVQELSLDEYRRGLLDTPGMQPFQPPMLTSIASSIRHNMLAGHHPDLADILGHEPGNGLEAAAASAISTRPG